MCFGCKRHGFTLIELLLVMAIIGVVTAIAVPSFVESIRGNRLMTATRTVVMAGRYARSMAVLKQKDLSVTFNLGSGQVSVGNELKRKLDKVSIEYVEILNEDELKRTRGTCAVVYRNNGTCTPYRVKVVDKYGESVIVEVDRLSSARTERGL